MSARYQLIEDDERMDLSAGDIVIASPYRYEPDCKLTVHHRESDGFDPECNLYRCQVRNADTGRGLRCTCGCGPASERDL